LRSAQAQLEGANEELKIAATHALDLANKAEAANHAKSNFLAVMSHEIRTPLNGVLGTAELLLEDELTMSQRSSLETIRSSGNQLLASLNDVLDFSKIESGNFTLETLPFSPARCVQETLQLFFGRAQARRLRLMAKVDPAVPAMVEGDATRLRQILANLVSNAIKFTERGEVEVSVSRGLSVAGKTVLNFSVRDTGMGIPHEKQAMLFQAFNQLDASTQRRFGGTGLGLAICKRLVAWMGGQIEVDSTVGRGSIFSFNIQVAPLEKATPVIATRVIAPARTQELRILVVEDERINQQITLAMLGRLKHTADVARSGIEAVDALRNRSYDVVFMDWHMPEMNGLDATRVIRTEFDITQQPWIIALTASALPEDRDTCLNAGMNDYLTKPLKLDALKGALLRFAGCESR